jgi:preprotein translocase subunit SecF
MINFMKYKLVYFFISALFLLPSAYFLIRFGLKPAVDFTGGTLLELVIQPEDSREISLDEFRQSIAPIVEANSIQRTASNTFLIRAQSLDQAASAQLRASLSRSFGSVTEKSFATIGPTLGKELIKKTLFGILLAGGFIFFMLPIASRIKNTAFAPFSPCFMTPLFLSAFLAFWASNTMLKSMPCLLLPS